MDLVHNLISEFNLIKKKKLHRATLLKILENLSTMKKKLKYKLKKKVKKKKL